MRRVLWLIFCAVVLLMGAAKFAGAQELHEAYLLGYPDGSMHEDAVLTREELAQCLYRLSVCENVPQEQVLFDVVPTRWSYRAVCFVIEHGIMEQRHARFSPRASVTGKELGGILQCASGVLPALKQGWEDLAELGTEQELTRGKFSQVMNEVLGRLPADGVDANLQEASHTHTCVIQDGTEIWTGFG